MKNTTYTQTARQKTALYGLEAHQESPISHLRKRTSTTNLTLHLFQNCMSMANVVYLAIQTYCPHQFIIQQKFI